MRCKIQKIKFGQPKQSTSCTLESNPDWQEWLQCNEPALGQESLSLRLHNLSALASHLSLLFSPSSPVGAEFSPHPECSWEHLVV